MTNWEAQGIFNTLNRRITRLESNFCCFKDNICTTVTDCGGSGNSQDLQQVTNIGSTTNNNIIFNGVNGNGNTLFINGASINIDFATNGNLYFTNGSNTLIVQPITTFSQSYVLSLPLNNGILTTSVNGIETDNSGSIITEIILPTNTLISNGITTNFSITHGQSTTPTFILSIFKNDIAASGQSVWLNWDATNIFINYILAPGPGTLLIDFLIKL